MTGKAKTMRKWIALTIAGTLWIQPVLEIGVPSEAWFPVHRAEAASTTKLSESNITSGAQLLEYRYNTTRSGKSAIAIADVVKVDLQNPYVNLNVMTGQGGKFTTRQSVEGMAKETNAVAGVNGDYFNTSAEGVPMGAQASDGVLMSSPSQLAGMYAFGVTKSGTPMIEQFTFEGKVTAEDGSTFDLAGINQASYMTEPDKTFSHTNKLYIYTDAWKAVERPANSSTTPTEVLVQDGVITQISLNKGIKQTVPAGAYILRAHGTAAKYIQQHMAVGQKVSTDYALKVRSTGKTVDPADLKMMIGGHTIMVDQGKTTSFSRNVNAIGGNRARTAVGYSQNGRYAYIIAVQDNNNSAGMSLYELQSFMVSIGVWKGINLDGGGSTTLVTRPLGEKEAELTFETEYGGTTQRSVVNGLGVYTTAPQGSVKGFNISGPKQLLLGQTAKYTANGYDTYYNPINNDNIKPTWKAGSSNIKWTGSEFKATGSGTAKVIATSNGISTSMNVDIVGADAIQSLAPASTTATLKAGTTIAVPVTAKLKNGSSMTISPETLDWEFIGFKGTVKDDQLTINSVDSSTTVGYAIARYDGFSTMMVLTTGGGSTTTWEDFENTGYSVSFLGNPSAVTGTAAITQGADDHSNSKVLQLTYDMTNGTGKKYAYAQLNGNAGKTLNAGTKAMAVDVYGDQSFNWLRAEVADASGKTVYIDLAKSVNWKGWKTLNVDLSSLGISYPAKLKRIYLVNVEEGQDERAATGSIQIDNIKLTGAAQAASFTNPSGTLAMTVGQKTATLNGKSQSIDAAPMLRSNATYIPVKYIIDAFGGQANWDQKNQRVTILRSGELMDLTVGDKQYVMNGKLQSSSVAPLVVSGRTLVPLRLVSEELGLTVKWDQKTKTITVQS